MKEIICDTRSMVDLHFALMSCFYLQQAESAFPELDQSSYLEPSLKPLIDSLVKHKLLQHKDKDIRLLVALCFCEIIRVLAPSPDLTDVVFKV